jgi:hypothetical protein
MGEEKLGVRFWYDEYVDQMELVIHDTADSWYRRVLTWEECVELRDVLIAATERTET